MTRRPVVANVKSDMKAVMCLIQEDMHKVVGFETVCRDTTVLHCICPGFEQRSRTSETESMRDFMLDTRLLTPDISFIFLSAYCRSDS